MNTLYRWIFTDDRPQRIRLAQAALANALMLGCVALLHIGADPTSPEHRWVWPWTAASIGGMVVVFAVIRSGVARQWKDPSLAAAQMFYAMACAAAAYLLAGAVRTPCCRSSRWS